MKVRNISVYECGVCGCCYNTGAAAKRCETRHFKLTGTPKVADFYYEKPRDWPETIVVTGMNGNGSRGSAIYRLAVSNILEDMHSEEPHVLGEQRAYLDEYYDEHSSTEDPSEGYIPIDDDDEEQEGDPIPF